MHFNTKRKSWDTAIKHLTRHGLLDDVLTKQQKAQIPSSNLSRWKYESDNKYLHSDINKIIKQEIELIKRINQSTNIKRINQSYFKLADTFHEIISKVKGVKSIIRNEKELLVNSILCVKDIIPIDNALKIFNISRSTFENYKSIIIHKCDASYFKWCTKRFPSQLLPSEVSSIKKYMTHTDYQFWSKSSIYLKAVRDNALNCCISTFYKYCRLLGFKSFKKHKKSDNYNPKRTSYPNELWCADVTIFKTQDGVKHYIHFLIDHYSKMILGYKVEKFSSAKAIRGLLFEARKKYKPERLHLLTDGGSENVNAIVSQFLNFLDIDVTHNIAQKDVAFSNSMIEAVNKVIKHQFLYPKNICSKLTLLKALNETVGIYNHERPQMNLGGNTPFETFNGLSINFNKHKTFFEKQKMERLTTNKESSCKLCF